MVLLLVTLLLQINLITQLSENDKTKERLSEILEERDLTFLYPLLRIQADLSRQLQADPNPQSFYKWIKENLEQSNFNDPGFINALMTVLLKYISQVSFHINTVQNYFSFVVKNNINRQCILKSSCYKKYLF